MNYIQLNFSFQFTEEFKRKEAVYLERVAELDEISAKRDRARKRHDDLRKTRLNEFMEGFGIITAKLKEMYQVRLSNQGDPSVCEFSVSRHFFKTDVAFEVLLS